MSEGQQLAELQRQNAALRSELHELLRAEVIQSTHTEVTRLAMKSQQSFTAKSKRTVSTAEKVGPSPRDFAREKAKIEHELISCEPDNSKKGGVDAPIEELLSFINSVPTLVSTSSCSGRVAVFCQSTDQKKQHGNWAYVSHDEVSKLEDIRRAVTAALPVSAMMHFKFEPLVLHISCADLATARRLMKIVLRCGYKNSGMLVGKRIMVGIRSTLKVDVPIAADGELLVSDKYLDLLVRMANEKMATNIQRTNSLFAAIKEEFS